jgi:putative ABC transport system permease protein
MMLGATAQLAFSALLRNKMRSLLTMLGIVIGVGAVIMMGMMGGGATAYIGESISGLGSNMLFIVPGITKGLNTATQGVPLFTSGDVQAIRRQARDVAHIAPVAVRPMRVVVGSNNRLTNAGGVSPEYFEIREWDVHSGRLVSSDDEREGALVCDVGQTIVDTLFNGESPIGKDIRLHDLSCRVIGVMDAKGSTFGADSDDVVLLPFSTFSRRVIGQNQFHPRKRPIRRRHRGRDRRDRARPTPPPAYPVRSRRTTSRSAIPGRSNRYSPASRGCSLHSLLG